MVMACISMDLLGQCNETTRGHHCALTVIEVIPIEDKKTETVIKTYIKYVYSDKGGSKFILTDIGGEFSSEAMSYIADQQTLQRSTHHYTHLTQIAVLRDVTTFLIIPLGR